MQVFYPISGYLVKFFTPELDMKLALTLDQTFNSAKEIRRRQKKNYFDIIATNYDVILDFLFCTRNEVF